MATRLLRQLVKRSLRSVNRQLVKLDPHEASGLDLIRDLRLVVGHDSPVCLDIGANEGQTIALLSEAFRDPVIHAFEPSRATFAHLEARGFSGRVTLHNCALGREAGTRTLVRYASSDLSSFLPLDRHDGNRFRDTPVDQVETVDTRTVDEVLDEHGIGHVDLMKIDTQGTELDVLAGATRALSRGAVRAVLVELNFVQLYEGQCPATAVIDHLASHRLTLVDLYEKVRQEGALGWCTALFRLQAARS